MPGLQLTRPQAQRLWGLDEQTCAQLLESLMQDKFLYRRDDGMYARCTEGAVTFSPLRMVNTERSSLIMTANALPGDDGAGNPWRVFETSARKPSSV